MLEFTLLLFLCLPAQDSKAMQDKLDDQEDRIRDLERKLQDLERRQTQVVSANPLTVLNPAMTVIGDYLWRFDDQKLYLDNDPALDRIDDSANLREMELDLRAAVDPFVSAVGILAVASEIPGEYDVEVEEFYANVKALPLPGWEAPPLGTQIKVGRFRTEFGLNNRSHTHDLPQSDRPLAIETFLGPEGHIANGISLASFLPSPGESALQATAQVLQGGGIGVAQDPHHFAYLFNLNFFVPLSESQSLNTSVIGFYGTNDADGRDHSRVASLDLSYRWKPLRQGEYASLLIGGQAFAVRHDFVDPATSGSARSKPLGASAFAQYQFSSRLYVGLRWDSTDALEDDDQVTSRVTPYLTWYSSEFFRVRASYEHTKSDNPVMDDVDTFMVELVVVFGSHPTEPYWVNK